MKRSANMWKYIYSNVLCGKWSNIRVNRLDHTFNVIWFDPVLSVVIWTWFTVSSTPGLNVGLSPHVAEFDIKQYFHVKMDLEFYCMPILPIAQIPNLLSFYNFHISVTMSSIKSPKCNVQFKKCLHQNWGERTAWTYLPTSLFFQYLVYFLDFQMSNKNLPD